MDQVQKIRNIYAKNNVIILFLSWDEDQLLELMHLFRSYVTPFPISVHTHYLF